MARRRISPTTRRHHVAEVAVVEAITVLTACAPIYELQTIVQQPYPCTTSPCFDPAVFGSTAAIYWSDTTLAGFPFVWFVNFNNGAVYFDAGNATFVASAVRGGL